MSWVSTRRLQYFFDKCKTVFYHKGNKPTASDIGAVASMGLLTLKQVSDATYQQNYEGHISVDVASAIGLEPTFYYIKYFAYSLTGGYGTMIAIPLQYINVIPKFRASDGATWTDWATGFLPLEGGKANPLIGSIYVSNGYTTLFGGDTGSSVAHFPDKNDTTNGALFELKGGLSNLKGAFNFVKRVNGVQTIYALFGEHNKTSGTYSGNGSSTYREINTGGIGNILFITSQNRIALVTNHGFIAYTSGSDVGTYSQYLNQSASFENGILKITTNHTCINGSGLTYSYQVL